MAGASPQSRKTKRGKDGVTDLEREFVRHRRADPAAPNHEIMKRAGYKGDDRKLAERARLMLRNPRVAQAVYAPVTLQDLLAEIEKLDDEALKKRMRAVFYRVATSPSADDGDRIRAADRLLATVPGGFVPLQINSRNALTLESMVHAMGGAPPDYQPPAALPAKEET